MRSGVIVLGFITGLGGLAASGGCGFSSPPSEGGADGPGIDACVTFASQVDTCQLTFGDDLTLSGSKLTYDTRTHELFVDGVMMPVAHKTFTAQAGDVDAIFAHNVRITSGAGLSATGPLPFAIVASGSVTLDEAASIDVGRGGAGAQASCANPPVAGEDNAGGAAGGGGGGYGAAGGKGGDGDANGTRSTGGAGEGAIAMPAGPRGGCPGAHGGAGNGPAGVGGAGGLGGGALYLVAADRIELGNMAVLTAGGGGGHGGGHGNGNIGNAGGGGGGSGGMIFVEAPHVIGTPQSRVAANGGGGGEGSEVLAGGGNGDDGTTSTTRASGGRNGSARTGDGGLGGSRENPVGETVTMLLDGGGGGGGGSVGFIHIVSPDIQLGSVSPAAN